MKISLITAMGENFEIGLNNDLLWHLPRDMRFFTETTKGHCVIMGRKNWDSIPLKYRPLKNRTNIVVSRKKDLKIEGGELVSSVEEAIALAENRGDNNAFIIGGGQIYDLALKNNLVDSMCITWVHQKFEADTYFPQIDLSDWRLDSEEHFEADEKNRYAFTIAKYQRKG
jgi:dihydrofolate reductase